MKQMPVQIMKMAAFGWPNCYRISNGEVEAIVTSDIGPRIMRYGFVGGQNFMKEFKDQLGKSGEKDWQARGGHRLWISPEDAVKTYAPDNGPIKVEVHGDAVESIEPVEPLTGLEKRITVKMAAEGSGIEILHQIRNSGSAPYRLAPWALTMMAPGGAGIHGFPPRGTHPKDLAPTNPLVMWAYTNLSDPRWHLLRKYLVLVQDPNNPVPQKLGSFNPWTWGAYLKNSELFVKRARAEGTPEEYPDYGCSFEMFTNNEFLELETVGRLVTLQPGQSVNHTENWSLHKNVRVPHWTDDELDRSGAIPGTVAR